MEDRRKNDPMTSPQNSPYTGEEHRVQERRTTTRSPRLDVRVAVLEDRMERVQTDVKIITDKLDAAVDRIERSITDIRDKPNAVAQFLQEHWKTVVVAVAALLGANATVIDVLSKLT